jgi:sulfur carrier protein
VSVNTGRAEVKADSTDPGNGPACRVNGASWQLSPGTTVGKLVDTWCTSREGIAVALNKEVVPRSLWVTHLVQAGDEVEIVTASAGG